MKPTTAQWEQFHAEKPSKCHHVTWAGTRCTRPRIPWPDDLGIPDPHTCTTHLDVTERSALEEFLDRTDESRIQDREYERWATYDDPACWSWEAPDMDRWEEYRDTLPVVARPTLTKEICHEALLKRWHAGRCAICAWDKERLLADHDHETGWVRGWLCRSCNTREAINPGGIWEKYRQRNPAGICGVQVMYISPYSGLPWIPRTPAEIEAAERRAEEEANWRVLRRRGA